MLRRLTRSHKSAVHNLLGSLLARHACLQVSLTVPDLTAIPFKLFQLLVVLDIIVNRWCDPDVRSFFFQSPEEYSPDLLALLRRKGRIVDDNMYSGDEGVIE